MERLRIHYCISPQTVLHDLHASEKFREMKRAGVGVLWLFFYFYGHFTADADDIENAKRVLEQEGFKVNALSVPLGHGGNAFDPANPGTELTLGNGWRPRVDIDGNALFNCACVSEKLLADSAAAAMVLPALGIDTLFFDDDLRLGHWGPRIQGCFCDDCLRRFGESIHEPLSRTQLKKRFDASDASATAKSTLENWMDFNCGNILRFLETVPPPGVTPGIMAMHNADRRHGVDIRRIREALPGTLIRVGEGHFSDASFTHPDAAASLTASIQTHLTLAGKANDCYSESTVFPMFALSPQHWIEKIRLEIRFGLRNLFLMSGTRHFAPVYWRALADALPELEDLAQTEPEPPHREQPFLWQL